VAVKTTMKTPTPTSQNNTPGSSALLLGCAIGWCAQAIVGMAIRERVMIEVMGVNHPGRVT
jgi:hypothetical protein